MLATFRRNDQVEFAPRRPAQPLAVVVVGDTFRDALPKARAAQSLRGGPSI